MFAAPGGPCYRCLHPEPPPAGLVPSCAEAGVLGVLPGIIGTIQATEALKLILGIGEPLIGRFLIYDALKMRFRELKLPKDPDCPVCGNAADDQRSRRLRRVTARRPARGDRSPGVTTSWQRMTRRDGSPSRSSRRDGRRQRAVIIDVREPHECADLLHPRRRADSARRAAARGSASSTATREIVVHCKSGGRSASAVGMARRTGLHAARATSSAVSSSWINEIDPSQPKY